MASGRALRHHSGPATESLARRGPRRRRDRHPRAAATQSTRRRSILPNAVERPRPGIVKLTGSDLLKLQSRTFSGCELAPLGQGSGPVLVENVAAGEMALVGEVVVDRGLDSGTLLQALDVPDPGHHPVPPSNRWMRVLGSGVKPASAFPPSKTSERLHRSRIKSQPVGDD